MFTSDHNPGPMEWKLDARRFIAGIAKSAIELVPPAQHVFLQAKRVIFVGFQYWSKAHSENLSADSVKGCDESNGFHKNGYVLFKTEEYMTSLAKKMSELVAKCTCTTSAFRN